MRLLKTILTVAALVLTGVIIFKTATYDANQSAAVSGGGTGGASGGDEFDASFNRFVSGGFGRLPLKVNDQMTLTRLTSADRNITFYFVVDLGGAEVDKRSLKRQEPQMKAHFCGNPLFTSLERYGAKATVAISDTRNRQVHRFFLNPKNC